MLIDQPGSLTLPVFDDDGRAWYTANLGVPNPPYPGYREIWMQEFDCEQMRLVATVTLWNGVKKRLAPEASHLYKVDGTYYLMLAEGGTHDADHRPQQFAAGPIRATRATPSSPTPPPDYPITNPGHADRQTQNEWMVALASRPYGGYFYNLGRETFLTPVRWEEGWPVVSPGEGRIAWEYAVPDLPEQRWPSVPACDHFDSERLAYPWNFLRTPREEFWSLRERPGYLRLKLRPERLSDLANPSFVGRRQEHKSLAARTAVEFSAHRSHESAGLVLLQNKDYHFRLVCTRDADGSSIVRLIQRHGETIGHPTNATRRYIKIKPSNRTIPSTRFRPEAWARWPSTWMAASWARNGRAAL